MDTSSIVVAVFAVLFSVAESKSDLRVICGNPKTSALIKYTGDAVAIFGYGSAKSPCKFVEDVSTASFTLRVSYNPKDKCSFVKTSPSRDIYGMRVESRLLHELFEGADDERFIVECSFMTYKPNIAVKVNLKETYKPAKMILVPKGSVSKDKFELFLKTVTKKRIYGLVPEYSLVSLNARMFSKSKNGFQPLQCMAESADGKVKILVLASGCGTGYPWKKNEGFNMVGHTGSSPAFRMFRISKKQGVVFRCSFVVCSGPCNTNSCVPKGRKRRSIEKGLHYNGLGLLSEENESLVHAAVKIGMPEEKTPYKMVKASVFTTIIAVSTVVLVAGAVVTGYVIARVRRQRAAQIVTP